MSEFFKKLVGKLDQPVTLQRHPAPVDPGTALAAYERLAAAALLLRNLDAELAAAEEGLGERVERARASVEEFDRLAQAAIAGGRTIQAESAIAASEAAQATLDALAPRAGELEALRAETERTAGRIEAEAAALKQRVTAQHPISDPSPAVARAEDDAVRLTALARTLSG